MSTSARPEPDATATPPVALRPTRGIAATWWNTFIGIVFIESVLALVLTLAIVETVRGVALVVAVGTASAVWVLATVPLLLDYRNRADRSSSRSLRALTALTVALAYGALAGLVTGSWLVATFPVVAVLMLLRWPAGIRVRLAVAATVVLGALWAIDAHALPAPDAGGRMLFGLYATLLPGMIVLSLWWWDVLVALDRARASEARLAATQERLRLATDVHDLQGHHLQVIGLQLELVERLMGQDDVAALAHLRTARASVDEARQGTRDLALRFRSVPIHDELANAVDLLRVAGMTAEAVIAPDADDAPASVIGPVVREATTNILRHGGGRRARLSLVRDGGSWRFEASNDAAPARPAGQHADGSGLEGIRRRVGAVGGTLEVRREPDGFTVVVVVPAHVVVSARGGGER